MPRPEVQIRQVGNLFFGSGSTAPAYFELDVNNPGSQPLRVRRVRIESPGMATYGIRPMERVFNEAVAPGETKTVRVDAMAITSTTRPTEPLTIRATVYFDAEGKNFREFYQGTAATGPY